MQEIWKDVKGYEGHYMVSNLGRVKSIKRKEHYIFKPTIDGHGYYKVELCLNGKQKTHKIHKLVATNFLGHTPSGMKEVVDHINNDKLDNRLSNLRLVSNRFNVSRHTRKTSSKYTGVTWCKHSNRWLSRIKVNNKSIYLGGFKCELAAHLAYQNKLKELTLNNKL